MSDDYAELVRNEFGGHVDLVLGVSYGGLVAQHFAADHGELFDCLVIVMAAHVISDEAKRIDSRYAELIGERRDREAMALRADAAFTGIARRVMAGVLWLFGKALLGEIDETFRRDVVIEARAEADHDAREALGRIRVPVLIVGGTDDLAFPLAALEEMHRLIPGSELKIYEAATRPRSSTSGSSATWRHSRSDDPKRGPIPAGTRPRCAAIRVDAARPARPNRWRPSRRPSR